MNVIETVIEAKQMPHEVEWIELKTNFWNPKEIGEYISALSNSATIHGKKAGFMIWGIDDENHQLTGTSFDYQQDVSNEPFKHFLARQLNPSINFEFYEDYIDDKRVVLLYIPAAKNVPTEFNKERYIRIGSSKENLRKYPQREANLWNILSNGLPSLTNVDSERQDLTFEKLFLYYGAKNKKIDANTFKKNLNLINEKTGKYNLLALLLADDNAISCRISIFNGEKKYQGLKSVKEFGNTCILYALDGIANYGKDVLNSVISSEEGRVLERKDVNLFDNDAYREAIINSFVHNYWQHLNSPQISVFSDRIEILSHGTLGPDQTLKGFFNGESKPVNPSLAHVFMQLGISDRSGKGVPTIVEKYGRECFTFGDDSITLTIPFVTTTKKKNNKDRIINEIRTNSNITALEISQKLDISLPMVNKLIRELKQNEILVRKGSNKNGYWEIVK